MPTEPRLTVAELQQERDEWIAKARARTGNTAPVQVATLERVFQADLRRYAGNPHDLDLHLRWLYESVRAIGFVWSFSPTVEEILSGDSLYQREQLKRALQKGVAEQQYYERPLFGFHPDSAAYDHAKYFETELEERQERDY